MFDALSMPKSTSKHFASATTPLVLFCLKQADSPIISSSGESLGALLADGGSPSAGDQSLNLGLVGGVSHEGGELSGETFFGELEDHIVLVPELLFVGLGGLPVDLNAGEAESLHYAGSGMERLILGELSEGGVEVVSEASTAGEVDVVAEGGGVGLGDFALLNEVGEPELEHVLSVVLPHSAEVGLLREVSLVLVGVDHILLGDKLGYELACGLPLLLELLTALRGGGVNTEDKLVLLVSMGEAVECLLGVIEVTTVSEPGRLGDLVVEEAGGVTLAPLLKSEPVEDVGLHSLTGELHGGPLRVEVVHGVLPCLSGVGIELPAVALLSGGPVGYLEALEEGSGLSIESHVSHTLEEGIGVEVLSVDVVLNVGLLMEFIAIEVLNSNTYIILN